MEFAVKPTHERGRRLSDAEIDAMAPVVGNLSMDRCPREDGGPERTVVDISTPARSGLIKPIIEPRLYGFGTRSFFIRGLEELKTERGWVYVLQEWQIEERPLGR